MHVAILGAGPIGIESALAAREMGHDVTVLEQGDVAAGVCRWGHVKMFTPWQMNTTARGRSRLRLGDLQNEGCPTGDAFAHDYLRPLANELTIRTHTRVLGVGKVQLRKGQLLGSLERLQVPFELLVRRGAREEVLQADAVMDCTGVLDQPNPVGGSGLHVPGERAAAAAGRVVYGPCRPELQADADVLLVGDGASAITMLAMMLEDERIARIHWLTPAPTVPGFVSPPADPLPSRKRLFQIGRDAPFDARVTHHPSVAVTRMEHQADAMCVSLSTGSHLQVHAALVCTGYRPDLSILRELQAHWCWGSDGPMKLAATLLANASGDCLQTTAVGADVLRHPEPGLFVLGAKSFGRRSDFLLTRGHEQIEQAIQLLGDTSPRTPQTP